jgi:hypothetical protein
MKNSSHSPDFQYIQSWLYKTFNFLLINKTKQGMNLKGKDNAIGGKMKTLQSEYLLSKTGMGLWNFLLDLHYLW